MPLSSLSEASCDLQATVRLYLAQCKCWREEIAARVDEAARVAQEGVLRVEGEVAKLRADLNRSDATFLSLEADLIRLRAKNAELHALANQRMDDIGINEGSSSSASVIPAELLAEHKIAFQKVCSDVQAEHLQVPWELRYALEIDPEAEEATVSFHGGTITDAQGKEIWIEPCVVCDRRHQPADERYYNIDGVILCVDCHFWFSEGKCITSEGIVKEEVFRLVTETGITSTPYLSPQSWLFTRIEVLNGRCLTEVLYLAGVNYGSRPFCVAEDGSVVTYRAALEMIALAARHIQSLLVDKTDDKAVVLLWYNQCREFVLSDMACALAGVATVGVGGRDPEKVGFLSSSLNVCLELGPQHESFWDMVQRGRDDFHQKCGKDSLVNMDDLETLVGIVGVQASNLWFTYNLSSGTSGGQPKALKVPTHAWLRDIATLPLPAPIVHFAWGNSAAAGDRITAWAVVVGGGLFGFPRSPDSLWEDLRTVSPSFFSTPPSLMLGLFQRYHPQLPPREVLGTRCRSVAIGGSAVPPSLVAAMKAAWGSGDNPMDISEGFGSSEVGGIATDGVLGGFIEARVYPVEYWDEEDSSHLSWKSSGVGILAVKSPFMFNGYLETEDTPDINKGIFDSDGYFVSHDIVRLDGQKVEVLGRAGEMVKTGTANFTSLASLEASLCQCVGLGVVAFNCAFLGVLPKASDGSCPWGPSEQLVAAVFSPQGHDERVDTFITAVRQSAVVDITGVVVVPEKADVFHTVTGKTQRWALRVRLLQELFDHPSRYHSLSVGSDDTAADDVCRFLGRLSQRKMDPKVSWRAQGGTSSLALAAIERFRLQMVSHSLTLGVGDFLEIPIHSLSAMLSGDASATDHLLPSLESFPSLLPLTRQDTITTSDCVLVTGASGFLGSHVVKNLVSTRRFPKVFSLHRSLRDPIVEGLEGVSFFHPVLVPDFGCEVLSEESRQRLAEVIPQCSVVIHCAAVICFSAGLRAHMGNVYMASHLVQLIATVGSPDTYLLFTSTQSVSDSTYLKSPVQRPVDPGDEGYADSKFVVEHMLQTAARRGLLGRVSMFRLPFIGPCEVGGCTAAWTGGDSFSSPRDWLGRALAGVAKLGISPTVSSCLSVSFASVSYVVDEIINDFSNHNHKMEILFINDTCHLNFDKLFSNHFKSNPISLDLWLENIADISITAPLRQLFSQLFAKDGSVYPTEDELPPEIGVPYYHAIAEGHLKHAPSWE